MRKGDNSEVAKPAPRIHRIAIRRQFGISTGVRSSWGDFQSSTCIRRSSGRSADASSNAPQARVYASLSTRSMTETGHGRTVSRHRMVREVARTSGRGQASAWIGGVTRCSRYLLVQNGPSR